MPIKYTKFIQFLAPVVPHGPNGLLSQEQCSDSIMRLQRNMSRMARMVRDTEVRVSDIEREKVIG